MEAVLAYRWIAEKVARLHGLDTALVLAVIATESSGNTYAIRVERGFWKRYGANFLAFVKRTLSTFDDRWAQYPDIASCSYGLMQCLYPVALERGMNLRFPTELCRAETGIEAGCRQLRYCLDSTALPSRTSDQNLRAGLLRYNGGGDPAYPDRVLGWLSKINLALRQKPEGASA